MKKKIILITSNEIRHKFFRKFLNKNEQIEIKKCLIEEKKIKKKFKSNPLLKEHFKERNLYEKRFFDYFIKRNKEPKNIKFLKKKRI